MARYPTIDELDGWQTLTIAARTHALAVLAQGDATQRLPNAEGLVKARKAMRNACLPVGQQMRGSPMSELVRAVDRWAVLNAYDRRLKASELHRLAIEAAKQAGFDDAS